jgi:hypothetical protein
LNGRRPGGAAKEELVAKGISERFDEEEQDTARRDYSRDVLDQAKKTAHHRVVKLEEPRTSSGTRAIISRSAIEAHLNRLPNVADDADADARPTVAAGVERLQLPLGGIPDSDAIPIITDPPDDPASASVVEPAASVVEPAASARPIYALLVVALALFAAALGGVGFILGRMSIHH